MKNVAGKNRELGNLIRAAIRMRLVDGHTERSIPELLNFKNRESILKFTRCKIWFFQKVRLQKMRVMFSSRPSKGRTQKNVVSPWQKIRFWWQKIRFFWQKFRFSWHFLRFFGEKSEKNSIVKHIYIILISFKIY